MGAARKRRASVDCVLRPRQRVREKRKRSAVVSRRAIAMNIEVVAQRQANVCHDERAPPATPHRPQVPDAPRVSALVARVAVLVFMRQCHVTADRRTIAIPTEPSLPSSRACPPHDGYGGRMPHREGAMPVRLPARFHRPLGQEVHCWYRESEMVVGWGRGVWWSPPPRLPACSVASATRTSSAHCLHA